MSSPGGGAELFGRDGVPELPALAARHGWSLVTEPAALSGAPASKALAVFPSGKNDVDVLGPRLPELARWALERLSADPDGFFLVVEHEGTDRAGHEGAPDDLRTSLRSFDEAVGVVADFARRRGDTLVLVVGDHETGGLRVLADASGALSLEYGTNLHTGSMVPLFAMGPGSERFCGLYENTDIARKVSALSGAEPLTAAARAREDEGPGTGERFRALSP
ncbi:alkaline phosphatase [Pyxidicoccus sp. 3LG]